MNLIKPRKPWRTIEEVELATAEWVDWFNHGRHYERCGDVPPVELEATYYAQRQRPTGRLSLRSESLRTHPGGHDKEAW